jgi:hypothetical protein
MIQTATIYIQVDEDNKITMSTHGFGIALDIAEDLLNLACNSDSEYFQGKDHKVVTND